MTNKKIPELDAVGLLGGTEQLHLVDADGNSRKVTLADLKTFINTDPTVVPSSVPWRGARVRRTSNFSLSSGTGTIVPHQEASEDTDNFWSAGASTRLTIPSGVTRVILSAGVRFNSSAGLIDLHIYKNGAEFNGMPRTRLDTNAVIPWLSIKSCAIPVVAGDYFEVRVIRGGGSGSEITADEGTWFAIEVIEATI